MEIQYVYHQTNNKTRSNFELKSKDDNPFRKMGCNIEIRKFLSEIEKLTIPIKYEINVKLRNRYLKLIWDSLLIYDFTNRALIRFRTIHSFKYSIDDLWYKALFRNFQSERGILNILTIILALIQIKIIIKRFYDAAVALNWLEEMLSDVDIEERESILNGEIPLDKGKTKWETLMLNEKRKFFNIWYIIILIANFFQILSNLNHLIFPVFTDLNQLLAGLSVIFTWLGCGYFLEYEDKYYFFYLTIKKSLQTNYKYLLVFILVFIGYSLLVVCTFNYSEKYYSSVHMTFISSFSNLFNDDLCNRWSATYDINPLITIIYSLFFFIIFVAFLLRILLIVTEESFDCIKMRKEYEWLDKKLSLKDYIQREIMPSKDSSTEDANSHHMIRNGIMNILILIESAKNVIPVEVQRLFEKEISQFKRKGLEQEEITKLIKKEIKKFYKKNNQKNNNLDFNNIYINRSANIQNLVELVNSLFNQIENIFIRINFLIYINKFKTFRLHERTEIKDIYIKLTLFSDEFLIRISNIKKKLKN